ncbi:MAG: PilZ domain-containing protein [Acidobacteria bacterium]|nr:PilZ domain-containing protein [Acidobacteriota bacterium]
MEKILGDRRASRRYPMELNLRYRAFRAKETLHSGCGTTCDLSSGGLSFHAAESLPLGLAVELAIEWPAATSDGYGTTLVSVGQVVRSDSGKTAIRAASYEFVRNASPGEAVQHAYVA